MKRRLGKQIAKKVAGESYSAYIPAQLPPDPAIDLTGISGLLEKATAAIGELNSCAANIPNTSLFLYMYVRKEALLSSQIEGTQSSFSDLILFEHNQEPGVSLEDVEEVSNYVKAIKYGLKRLKSGFPLSLRLMREIHAVLLSGGRGANKLPGEFRRSQNWIGGTRPGNALFVPPPVEHLTDCLSNFEKFLHDESLPVLIKAAVAHVQFETIHPFLDGNGRLGRLLMTLLLVEGGLLHEPILYLSLYLKQNRQTYYNLLQEVRMHGAWEAWIEFFLTGVLHASKQAVETAAAVNALFAKHVQAVESLGRVKVSCALILEYLKLLPRVTVGQLAKELSLSAPTVRNALNQMIGLGIIGEITGKKRDRVYVYSDYLRLLEQGAEPLN
jgi:Fic family protein